MDTSGLTAGVYLASQDQHGQIQTKSLDSLTQMLAGGDKSSPSIELIARSVSWVWVALNKRRQMLTEIPHEWKEGDRPIDPPLGINDDTLQRIDTAIQLYSAAFLFKKRSRTQTLNLIWYDPATMRVDDRTSNLDQGVTNWRRSADNGEVVVPAKNLLVLARWGMRELQLDTPAAQATRYAAEILETLYSMTDNVLDQGGIPPKIIVVPPGTPIEQRSQITKLLDRVISRQRKNRRQQFVSVSSDVKIHELSFAPSEVGKLSNVEQSAIQQVLAAHDVPMSVAFDNASNYATAGVSDTRFVRTMAARLQWIADILNNDGAFGSARLEVSADRHEAMQAEQLAQAEAVQKVVGTPVLTLNEGRELLGYEPVQNGDEIAAESSQPQAEQQPEMISAELETKSAAWELEARQFRTWYTKRLGVDPAGFNANHIKHADKLTIIDNIFRTGIEYP